MQEEKNIKVINNFILYCRGFEERKFSDAELFAAMESISDLIQKQQKEIKKKDKIIDEMCDYFSKNNNVHGNKEQIKQYFKEKAE